MAHRSKNPWLALTLVCGLFLAAIAARGLAAEPPVSKPAVKSPYVVQPVFDTAADLYFEPDGYLRSYAEAITRGWLLVMEQNNPEMFERFRTAAREPYGDRLPWDGEFPGKHLTGAVEIYRTTHNKALYQAIHDFVGRLVALQQPNGYLGVWAPQYELTGQGHKSVCGEITWDMWNHNHILLGLLAWYEESGDERALQCACRIADLFCAKFLNKPGEWGSLPEPYTNLSAAHTLALLYRWTREPKYLDLAKQALTAEASKCGLDFAARAKQGEDYCRKSTGAGGTRWETLHVLLAYSEMYLLTGDADYRTVIEHYWRSLTRTDRHNNGGFSSLESACGNPFDTRSIETCCTVAYTALGVEALRLSGDSRIADQLEISAMNAGLAFFSRDGQCSTYNTVMEGRIVPCDPNRRGNPNPGIYCCTVNAPRGIGMISHWALMSDADGLVVNWFGPGVMTGNVGGNRVAIAQIKNYPREDSVRFVVNPEKSAEFALKFRIPFWSEETRLTVNGEAIAAKAGSYAAIKRTWKKGDLIDIALQMAPRYWAGKVEYAGRASIYRGPVLLAHPIAAPRENATFTGDWTDGIRVRETQYFSLVGSEKKGDRASFTFQGDWVAWRYNKCNVGGKARVFVDGKLLDTVDCYAENDMKDFFAYDRGQKGFFLSDRWQRDGFGPGEHTLVIEVTGEKNEHSQGSWIYLREFHDNRTDPKLDAASLAFELLPPSDPLGLDVHVAVRDAAGNRVELKDYDAASKCERMFLTWFQVEHIPAPPLQSNDPAVLDRQHAAARVPIVHSTDLFHPHGDPDDHYDLAYLFDIDEFDIRGIILDDHRPDGTQAEKSGRPPIEQMMHITGKKVPFAVGLRPKMRSRDDKLLDAPEAGQQGVQLLLSALRDSREKVVLNLVGSACDAAVAFNREPELARQKIKAIYLHAGNGPEGMQEEYNVQLDPHAYARVLESGLPVYWCPCFGKDGYETHFVVPDESVLIRACTEPVQNYFVYCLTKSKEDPIPFLSSGPHPIPTGNRNMWCVAPMLHAAGRKIYERGPNDFIAVTPENAQKAGLADKEAKVFEFVPVQFDTVQLDATQLPVVQTKRPSEPTGHYVFHITDGRYQEVLASVLKNLLADLGRTPHAPP